VLNCAIIGAGAISSSHIEAYEALRDRCKLVAIADTDLNRVSEKQRKYGLPCAAYDDYRLLIADPAIDLVSICTPPSTHARLSIECLSAGKHVIVEKPMASSLEECDSMIEMAEKKGKLLSVVAQNRFRTQFYRIKKLIDSKFTGELLHVAVNAFFWRGKSYYDLDWRGTWRSEGGGCTLNHAVHYIDQLLWIAGKPEKVMAFMTNRYHDNSETEDLSEAILKYSDGKLASITSSLVHHGENQGIIFQTEQAGFGVPLFISSSSSLENGFPQQDLPAEKRVTDAYNSIAPLNYEGHTGQIADVIAAIETGSPLTSDGYQGRAALELIMAIYKSACTGQLVSLPLEKKDAFYTKAGALSLVPIFHQKTKSITGFSVNEITISGENYNG
jgi:UDP-N-acetyl-2-amino-2-deoxyglucuronate dehydrogenase